MNSDEHGRRTHQHGKWPVRLWCALTGHNWQISERPGMVAPEYRGVCNRCGKRRDTLTRQALGGEHD